MPKKTHRPRITRQLRDRVLNVGAELNGKEPDSYYDALQLLCGYLDVLYGTVECPTCGEQGIEDFENGRYRCWRCDQDQEDGYFTVWDYLDAADREQASLPGLPKTIQHRFECDHEEHDSGSNSEDSTPNVQNQQGEPLNSNQDRWNDGF